MVPLKSSEYTASWFLYTFVRSAITLKSIQDKLIDTDNTLIVVRGEEIGELGEKGQVIEEYLLLVTK